MKKENVLQVVGQLVNMLNVNIKDIKDGFHSFGESFEGWCEEGDVFFDMNCVGDARECESIMYDLSEEIDGLINKIESYINQ